MQAQTKTVIETMINADNLLSATQKKEILAKIEIEDTFISAEKVGEYLGMAKTTVSAKKDKLPINHYTVTSGHRIFSLADTLNYRNTFIKKGKKNV